MAPNSLQNPLLNSYQVVASAFGEFLTVAVHTILYERDIYPRTSFLSVRKYNYPVRQNRHPKVCRWIQDAVAAVEDELLKGTVEQTSLIIYSPTATPLERFVFSTANFPIVPQYDPPPAFDQPPDAPTTTSTNADPTTTADSPPPLDPTATTTLPLHNIYLIDLYSQFRALFARLSPLVSKLSPLPPGCSFTLAIELRSPPQGTAPIGWPQPWVAAEPGLQPAERQSQPEPVTQEHGAGREGEAGGGIGGAASAHKDPQAASFHSAKTSDALFTSPSAASSQVLPDAAAKASGGRKPYVSQKGKYLGGARTVPIRSVEAGAFVMEFWVEEGQGKEDAYREAMAATGGVQERKPVDK